MPDDAAATRLKCFEYGETVQAEMHYAERQLETIERTRDRHAHEPPDILKVSGRAYAEGQAQVQKIQRETFDQHLERVVDALENGGVCGLPNGIVQEFGDRTARIKGLLDDGDFNNALDQLQTLRAELRHPDRML